MTNIKSLRLKFSTDLCFIMCLSLLFFLSPTKGNETMWTIRLMLRPHGRTSNNPFLFHFSCVSSQLFWLFCLVFSISLHELFFSSASSPSAVVFCAICETSWKFKREIYGKFWINYSSTCSRRGVRVKWKWDELQEKSRHGNFQFNTFFILFELSRLTLNLFAAFFARFCCGPCSI